jgi:hypothetical protein
MKTKYWLIICLICLLIGGGAWALIDHYFFPCTGVISIGPIDVGPTVITAPPGTPIDKCGALLFDAALAEDNKSIHVRTWNKCFSSTVDFPATCKAVPPVIKKWSIGLQLFLLPGYNTELKKFDALAGGELFFMRNFKYGSIGAGLLYQQGLMIKQYYAGAAVLAKFDI